MDAELNQGAASAYAKEHIPIMVVNAQHIKGVPGCKTDVKDAE